VSCLSLQIVTGGLDSKVVIHKLGGSGVPICKVTASPLITHPLLHIPSYIERMPSFTELSIIVTLGLRGRESEAGREESGD
jgi:hypothetical protein